MKRHMVRYILKAIPSGLFSSGITDQFDRRLSAIRRQNSEQVLGIETYHGMPTISELWRNATGGFTNRMAGTQCARSSVRAA
jgi:hypothetical protein